MKKYLILFLLFANGLFASPENACLILNTGNGTGTGFVLKKDDAYRLITNQHVISGAVPHSYERMDGTTVRPLTGLVANDRDLAIFTIEDNQPDFLELEPDLNDVAIGEEVIVYGNSLGQGMRISEAKIVAKSPDTIEISGGIVPGNSGGPIIRKKTGKVIGVSTYLIIQPSRPETIDEIIEAVTLPKIRYYGVRIDTARNFASFDLRNFIQEYNQLKAAKDNLDNALIISIMMLEKHGHRLSSEMRSFVNNATDKHHHAMKNFRDSGLYPGTYSKSTIKSFRRNTEDFFLPPKKPQFHIHQDEYTAIVNAQNYLKDIYDDILREFEVR